MEIILKGRIKSLVKDFGFIYSEIEKTDYFFHQSNYEETGTSLTLGDLVTFELRQNKGREGFHAINVKKLIDKGNGKNEIKPIKKPKYYFESKPDMKLGFKFIKDKLITQKTKGERKYEDWIEIEEKIDTYLEIIEDLFNGPSPNIEDISFEDINNSEIYDETISRFNKNYWRRGFNLQEFANNVESISSRETDKGTALDFSIVWHAWKSNEKQIFHAGYIKGFFNYSFIEKGAKEQTSIYDSPPPTAIWKLKKIKQKDFEFYITSAPVREVAQSSSVPALPPIIGVLETATRILDKQRNETQWQREIDPTRILKIKQFIGETNNIVANTPMLYIQNEDSIKIVGDELHINFSKFLKKQIDGEFQGKFIDRKPLEEKDEFGNLVYEDYRPFWIIDGQHRVRGIHMNELSQELEIPLIVFPNSFNISNTAKVFAEINTLQKKLNPLHELFMQHRFSIDHPTNVKRKFRDYTKLTLEEAMRSGWNADDWMHCRANHLSYEILAKLAIAGPLKNRVQFLPQNEDNNSIYITADQWVNYARSLFYNRCYKYKNDEIEDYVYKPDKEERVKKVVDIFYNEINNYFQAWVDTCNHVDWQDKRERWVDEVKGKGLIQKKTHFVILIELYDLVRTKAMEYKMANELTGCISVNEFKEVLKPFKWVDWRNKEIENTFPGSGEKGRRSLEAWMSDAILHGKQYPLESIMNSNFKSKPGQGIVSVLDTPVIEIISDCKWPSKGSPVIFLSKRPWNARYESTWVVEDYNNDTRGGGRISTVRYTIPMNAEFELKYESYMDNPEINELTIRVDWKNSQTITGKNTIKIKK